ncbi:MAG: hypothetical protein AAFR61_13185 [Bacteroidota bacterium]
MKKIFSPYLLSLLYLLAGAGLSLSPMQAQDVANSKMQRDLAMMEKAISEVFRSGNPDKDRLRVSTRKVKAEYTEGFGILIRTPLFYWNDNGRTLTVTGFRTPGQVIQVTPEGGVITTAPKDDDEKIQKELADNVTQEEIDEKKIEMMRYFLMNYGDLASELPKNERIMLIYGHRVENSLVAVGRWTEAPAVAGTTSRSRSRKEPAMISMSVLRDDVDKLRQRNLSEEDFDEAISIEYIKDGDQKRMAFDILGQIIQEVANKHKLTSGKNAVSLNGEYAFPASFGQPTASYEILAGYGVVYSLKLRKTGLRFVSNNNRRNSNIELEVPGLEQYEENLDSLYKEIVLDLQEAMIEYGRTLRDLKKNEWLVVKLDIPGCAECESPAEIQVRVPQNVLEDFDRRNISLDTALDRMDITSRGKAKDKSSESFFYWNEWDEE